MSFVGWIRRFERARHFSAVPQMDRVMTPLPVHTDHPDHGSRRLESAHPGGQCPAEKGQRYCSDYCESIGKQPSIACECGHAECAAGETVGAAG
jgi:hypothetical protein